MALRKAESPAVLARRETWAVVGVAFILLTIAVGYGVARHRVASHLLRADPAQILKDPELLQSAAAIGEPLYQTHCAGCHGAALQGSSARGTPNLSKNVWLYGNEPVNVERTILYGIRSGHPKARNVTDMPALVRSGQIGEEDAHDVVEFLKSLAEEPYDREKAQRGHDVYFTKGNCFDCHASDARGVADYGSPSLTGPYWLYGGDRRTLFDSIESGRHGICPAWQARLTALQIRSLAVYLVSATRTSSTGARP